MIKLIGFTFCCLMGSCAETFHTGTEFQIDINNTTDEYLYVYNANGYLSYSPTWYPDTLLPNRSSLVSAIGHADIEDALSNIPPHSIGPAFFSVSAATMKHLPADTMSFFIIYRDTLQKYGYDYVAANSKYEVRYDLSVDDMKSLGYIIPYPPSSEMSEMKMWPKYEIACEIIQEGGGQ